MALNTKFTGSWAGGMVAKDSGTRRETAVLVGANATLTLIENFVPPVFPLADKWNRAVGKNLPPELADTLSRLIEFPGSRFKLPELSGKSTWVYPVIANGKLYLRDQEHIWCYEVKGK